MTLQELRDMPMLTSVNLVVEDMELIIQKMPHGWALVYYKTMSPVDIVMTSLFVNDPEHTLRGDLISKDKR